MRWERFGREVGEGDRVEERDGGEGMRGVGYKWRDGRATAARKAEEGDALEGRM